MASCSAQFPVRSTLEHLLLERDRC